MTTLPQSPNSRVARTYAAVIGIVLCVDALVWVVLAVAK